MVLSQSDAAKRLTAAAAKGNTDEVRRMLGPECRVHPDTVNQFGKTALQVMMMGNSNVASLLLEHGADPNITDREDSARQSTGQTTPAPYPSTRFPCTSPNLKHPNTSGETAVDLARASSSCTPDVVELLERQLESKVFSHSHLSLLGVRWTLPPTPSPLSLYAKLMVHRLPCYTYLTYTLLSTW
uniref:Cyclin-dependent kinase inhibitor 2D (p19, inhibits CDK4) n=1 Tax=Oncorhynchus tshawytscha TaxID=74940 RepID=A0AAZ3R8K1_ONCTS